MNDEWGIPISKEKIIDRRNRLIEYQKTRDVTFSVGHQIIDENILDINYMLYEIERLNNIINEFEKWLHRKGAFSTSLTPTIYIGEVENKLEKLKEK